MHVRLSFFAVLGLALAIVGGGCVSLTPSAPTLSYRDFPNEGTESTVEIGSPLVYKSKVLEFDGIVLPEPLMVQGSGLNKGSRFQFESGEFIATASDSTRIYFYAVDQTKAKEIAFGDSGEFRLKNSRIGISENRTTGAFEAFHSVNGVVVTRAPIPQETRLERAKLSQSDAAGFRQELLYNGKSGDMIKVLYREFRNDMARPAFSQELTYDLSESDIIGFQGVRIRVLKTSNVEITYSVLQHFPTIAP